MENQHSYYGYLSQTRNFGDPIQVDQIPMVSCCCVTKERPDFLEISIQAFLKQSWPRKELIVLTDGGGSEEFQQIADRYESQQVRFFTVNGTYPLGHLRNMSLDMTRGDYYLQWDDDDFNAHDRILMQLAYLQQDSQCAMCFSDQLHIFLEDQAIKVFWNDWGAPIPGTVMVSHKYLCRGGHTRRYPENMSQGEDVEFLQHFFKKEFRGHGYLHAYIYHGATQKYNNTFDYNHHLWLRDHRSLDGSVLQPFIPQIEQTVKQLLDCGFDKLKNERPIELWGRTHLVKVLIP